jgi:hypothetical protein
MELLVSVIDIKKVGSDSRGPLKSAIIAEHWKASELLRSDLRRKPTVIVRG